MSYIYHWRNFCVQTVLERETIDMHKEWWCVNKLLRQRAKTVPCGKTVRTGPLSTLVHMSLAFYIFSFTQWEHKCSMISFKYRRHMQNTGRTLEIGITHSTMEEVILELHLKTLKRSPFQKNKKWHSRKENSMYKGRIFMVSCTLLRCSKCAWNTWEDRAEGLLV